MNKRKYLKEKGWHTWYNDSYWVKEDLVDKNLDYTNYGFSLEEAFEIERQNKQNLKIINKFGLVDLNIIEFLKNLKEKNK